MFFLLLLLSSFYPVCSAHSADTHWELTQTVIKNGLYNNTIYDLCYGSDDFVWLSTDKGLSRYDGFRFHDYPLIMSIDSLSTPLHQAVKTIHETPDGLFYALLYQGGIACFDKDAEKFLPVYFDKSFNPKEIHDLYWNESILYLATSQGLFESSAVRKTENGDDYIQCTLKETPLVKGSVDDICTDEETHLYFSVDRKKVMRLDLMNKRNSVIGEYNVVNELFWQHGYLWICGSGNDFICHESGTNEERMFSAEGMDKAGFSNSDITDMVFKDKQTCYLTTPKGLFELCFEEEDLSKSPFTLTPLTPNEKAFYSGIENNMTSLLWDDEQRILWVGTFGGGVVKFDISDSMYSRVSQNLNAEVTGIVEGVKGYIWLALNDGTIMKSTVPAVSVDTRFESWSKRKGLSGYNRIYKDKKGNIWFGNIQGEIVYIHSLTEHLETLYLQDGKGEKMNAAILCFCLDSWDRLWVGTSDGLMLVDPISHECRKIKMPEGIQKVFAIAEDREGNIWIGSDKGLKRLVTDGNEIRVKGDYEKENGLEQNSVQTIYVNNYNQIFAAYLNVVIRIDGRKKDEIESVYTLQNGLPNGHVACMTDDNIGGTWAGSNASVMIVRTGQEAFYDYLSTGDCSAVCRLTNGHLLWADSQGLFFFNPLIVKGENGSKQVVLTDVIADGKSIPIEERRDGQVILAKNNDIHIHFSDFHYGMMQRKIAYRLLPVDENWETATIAESLWYNKLPAGKYTLQVKLVFPDGTEGDTTRLEIVVKDKWVNSAWVYAIYALVAAGLIYFYSYFRKKNMKVIRRKANRDEMAEGYQGTIFLEVPEEKGTKSTTSLLAGNAVFENNPDAGFIASEKPSVTETETKPETDGLPGTGYVLEDETMQELPASMEEWIVEETEQQPSRTGTKKTILIVEDHKDIRLYLKVMFGNDYNLLMATNGQEGIDLAMAELPDLILCDVVMPVKDGLQCCREIREYPKTCGIPFIMLTAKVEDEDIIHGLELGADDYMLKPFTPRILKAKVNNLINSRQTLKQTYARMFMLPGTNVAATSGAEQPEEEVKMEDSFISSVIKIIEENICEADFSVKKLASEMNMSQPTLYRKVKQSTDYTIIELIRGVRMRRAGVLLKTKRYAVQEVAEMVGYNDIPTFRKHFVEAFGTTPSTYE